MGKHIYHYTNLNALSSIICKNDICLWASRYDCLNDPLEQEWAQEIVLKEIRKREDFKKLSDNEIRIILEKKPYVLSMCKDCDSRIMWRLYANDGMGVILVFKSRDLKFMARKHTYENPISQYEIFNDVLYANEQNVNKKIDKSLDKVIYKDVDEEYESRWIRACAYIKHEDFYYENEARYTIIRDFDNICISQNDNKETSISMTKTENTEGVKYRIRGEEPVPYLEVKIRPQTLEKVIIGYRFRKQEVVKDYIQKMLLQYGDKYKHVKIELSNVLYNV